MITVSSEQSLPILYFTDTYPEVADNTYRDASADLNNTEASFIGDGGVSTDQRKMNAVRAYFGKSCSQTSHKSPANLA